MQCQCGSTQRCKASHHIVYRSYIVFFNIILQEEESALHLSCASGDEGISKLLVEHHAHINAVDNVRTFASIAIYGYHDFSVY
jgi:hypothetical protein